MTRTFILKHKLIQLAFVGVKCKNNTNASASKSENQIEHKSKQQRLKVTL